MSRTLRWWPDTVDVHTYLPGLFREQPNIVDFGLSDGRFAMHAVEQYGARVWAAEPSPSLYEDRPRHPALHVENVAIGGTEKAAELVLHRDHCHSLFVQGADADTPRHSVQVWSLRKFLSTFEIDVVDLLKVDIEGAECEMFAAASDEDLQRCAQITVEFHDFMMEELAAPVAKTMTRIESAGFTRVNFSLNNGDVLFLRNDLANPLLLAFLRGPYRYGSGGLRRASRIFAGRWKEGKAVPA